MSGIKFSVDGGVTFVEASEGVRVVYEGLGIPGEDGSGELHLNLTHDGVVSDLWTTRDEPLDHNIGTSSELIEDLVERLVDDPVLGQRPAEGSVAGSHTVVFEVDVTADTPEEAARFALDDLRDENLGPWYAETRSNGVRRTVEVVQPSNGDGEQRWNDLIQAERWNDQSQLTRLEEFLREHGLFAKLAEYAEVAAREEVSNYDFPGGRG